MADSQYALSIRQPWAWAILHAGKDVENRTWPAPRWMIGKRFWVHASKWWDDAEIRWDGASICEIAEKTGTPVAGALTLRMLRAQTGGIVGSVRLVECVRRSNSPWFCGPYGFVLADPQPCEFRSCKGRLGFWKVDSRTWDEMLEAEDG